MPDVRLPNKQLPIRDDGTVTTRTVTAEQRVRESCASGVRVVSSRARSAAAAPWCQPAASRTPRSRTGSSRRSPGGAERYCSLAASRSGGKRHPRLTLHGTPPCWMRSGRAELTNRVHRSGGPASLSGSRAHAASNSTTAEPPIVVRVPRTTTAPVGTVNHVTRSTVEAQVSDLGLVRTRQPRQVGPLIIDLHRECGHEGVQIGRHKLILNTLSLCPQAFGLKRPPPASIPSDLPPPTQTSRAVGTARMARVSHVTCRGCIAGQGPVSLLRV